MPNLEPTYLRYIYDGLVKGSIHPENAAELPDGLIGLYEEAFDDRTSVVERQKLLQRFAIWALLKKEVSAAFVAEVLDETENHIQEFISTYSAWFNSPESGKYQLYHERLKVYLLQKLSEGEVHMLHEKLIGRLEQAIEEQKADEFEWYAREFLTSHLAVAAMLNGDGKKLIDLAYSQTHWQRQLKISKGYSWTKNGLKEVMSWASKYNDDEVIECGLQMVDLHHQEQNGAPQIVALVADGDFDAALKRIEQFGGNDKEGLQRKFILYMLCLMELTLLESKDKPNRKVGIEKLLKHLDEQLPVDHSVLNWNDFFPSNIVFKLTCILYEIGIDYKIINERTRKWDIDWIQKACSYSKLEIDVLILCLNDFGIDKLLSQAKELLFPNFQQTEKEKNTPNLNYQLQVALNEVNVHHRTLKLIDVSRKYFNRNLQNEALLVLNEASKLVRDLKDNYLKHQELYEIITEFVHQDKFKNAIDLYKKLDDNYWIDQTKQSIRYVQSKKLAENGDIIKAIQKAIKCKNLNVIDALIYCSNFIHDKIEMENIFNLAFDQIERLESNRAYLIAVKKISKQIAQRGYIKTSIEILFKSIKFNPKGSEEERRYNLRELCFLILKKQRNYHQTTSLLRAISGKNKFGILDDVHSEICIRLTKFGKQQEAINNLSSIDFSHNRLFAQRQVINILYKKKLLNEATQIVMSIQDDYEKIRAIIELSSELFKKGLENESENLMSYSLKLIENLDDNQEKCSLLILISSEQKKQKLKGQQVITSQIISIAENLHDERDSIRTLLRIIEELSKQKDISNSIKLLILIAKKIQALSDPTEKSEFLLFLSRNYKLIGDIKMANKLLIKSQEIALKNKNEFNMYLVLSDIAKEFVINNMWDKAEESLDQIIELDKKQYAFYWLGQKISYIKGIIRTGELATKKIRNDVSKEYFLNGCASSVSVANVNKKTTCYLLKRNIYSTYSSRIVLKKYAINKLFSKGEPNKRERMLVRQFNLNWEMELINQIK